MAEATPRHPSPFYCPYCGEDEIRPWGERQGEWACDLCRRVWRLHYVGARAAPGYGDTTTGPAAGVDGAPP